MRVVRYSGGGLAVKGDSTVCIFQSGDFMLVSIGVKVSIPSGNFWDKIVLFTIIN